MSPQARWRIAAASAVGSAHVARNESCEDAFAWSEAAARDGAPITTIVVADGAGSADRAERGARLTCESVVAWVGDELAAAGSIDGLTGPRVADLLAAHRERVDRIAAEDALERRDFASTLVAAVLSPTRSIFLQVGDGAIVARRGVDAEFEVVFWPDEGDYAGVTTFATDDAALDRAQACSWDTGVLEAALFTDGLQRLVLDYAARSAHGRFFSKMLGALSGEPAGFSNGISGVLAEYLASPDLDQRTDDDRTLVLVQRHDLALR